MKKLKYLTIILLLVGGSCKKAGLATFDDASSKNSIYFPYSEGANNNSKLDFSFGYASPATTDSVCKIVVKMIGNVAVQDRTYNLSIADTSTLKKGTDYDFLNSALTIKAGKLTDTLLIKFHRNARMQKAVLNMGLELKPNDTFTTAYYSGITGSVTTYYTRLTVTASDIASIPWFWDVSKNSLYNPAYNSYWGVYSSKKWQLMIQILKLDLNVVLAADYQPIANRITWGKPMQEYLDAQALAGHPIFEADGVTRMTMGAQFQANK